MVQQLSANMNRSGQLLQILKGCLNSNTVQMAQKQLVQYSSAPGFLSELLQLIPSQPNELVIMILSTVKNYVTEKYSHPHAPMPGDQKQLLRNNILNLFYIIKEIPQAVNLYKQIAHTVVAVDYDKYMEMFQGFIKEDLDCGSISAAVYFSRQVARFYQWLTVAQRSPLQRFIKLFFPKFEGLMEKILTDYNNTTRVLLEELLEMFYSSFHIEVPEYLRDFNNISKWLFYLGTVLKAPIDDFPNNHILISRIYVKFFTMYCRDGTDGKMYKGWGFQFRQKHALDLYNQIVEILVNPLGNEELMANIVVCLSAVVNNPDLRPLIQQEHCQAIIYKHLLPFMESTSQDYSYFKSDGLEYIRRSQDLTCHPYRRASLDLIKNIAEKFNFGSKSQLIKFIQYGAGVLGNSNFNDKQREVVIIVLADLATLIMKNKYLNENFETLLKQYFIPLIKGNSNIIVAQTLNMLAVFLRKAELSTQVVTELMALLYDKMCEANIVVQYYAILSFTELLDDKQALETARPHFQDILTIYVKLLEVIDHEGLISSLKSIVQCFSSEIVSVADDLSTHLFSMFYSLHNKEAEQNDDNEENQSRQATAALSTIKQILQSPLSEQTYYRISEKVMLLLQNLCSQYDDYFQEILNLLNTLVYRAPSIINYQFPFLLCRKLLEGDNQILKNCQNGDFVSIIAEAEKADTEYSQALISIVKNLVQKMPQEIVHRYPYSRNPEVILCMIENKKLSQADLSNLNTSEIDSQWNLILQSYTAVVYGLGEVCDPKQLKMLDGVSLYPWIQCRLEAEVIKKLMISLEDEEGDDDYYEQNTVQMLEKFANEDEEDEGDYYISAGGNYSYMYDSPYDRTKDEAHLLTKLRQLPAGQLNLLISQVPKKQRARLEGLMSQ